MTSKPRQSTYPIGKYLIQLWAEAGVPLARFMETLGYRNTSKAIKRFDAWLTWGIGEQHILESLRRWRPDIEAALDNHLKLTKEVLDIEAAEAEKERIAEARRTFTPFVQAIPERDEPSSITLFAFTGGNHRQMARLPDGIVQFSDHDRIQAVAAAIKSHMERSGGRTLYQGRIISYQAFLSFDAPPLTFTTDGLLVGIDTDKRPGDATLTIGNRRFPGVIL